jgi:hypothetical protein
MPSSYGGGPYGKGLYSLSSVFDLAGGIAPRVVFAGDLETLGIQDLAGRMTVQTTFGGAFELNFDLAGNMTARVGLAATIMGDKPVTGSISISISMAADLTVGSFWEAPEPCPPTKWVPATCASSPVLETV